jgi:4-hydroxyproline epimerase
MRVIDSHTEGEPTRVIIEGGPDLGSGPLADRVKRFAAQFDSVRSMAVNEPRGHDAIVGALLCAPTNPRCAAGIIFFNNVGYLGMCGHGTIGVAATLAYLGRLQPGLHYFETPVGEVSVDLRDQHEVEIQNVLSYRYRKAVTVDVPSLGKVTGDIAWGGNWFFLVEQTPVPLRFSELSALSRAAVQVCDALAAAGITGQNGAKIDHIEFFAAPPDPALANSRNFVMCPGGAYDRSPCGTGTSAKLACLAADGKLQPGQQWVQESIIGSRFAAHYRWADTATTESILPSIRGRAYVVADSQLLVDPKDPYAHGIGNMR